VPAPYVAPSIADDPAPGVLRRAANQALAKECTVFAMATMVNAYAIVARAAFRQLLRIVGARTAIPALICERVFASATSNSRPTDDLTSTNIQWRSEDFSKFHPHWRDENTARKAHIRVAAHYVSNSNCARHGTYDRWIESSSVGSPISALITTTASEHARPDPKIGPPEPFTCLFFFGDVRCTDGVATDVALRPASIQSHFQSSDIHSLSM